MPRMHKRKRRQILKKFRQGEYLTPKEKELLQKAGKEQAFYDKAYFKLARHQKLIEKIIHHLKNSRILFIETQLFEERQGIRFIATLFEALIRHRITFLMYDVQFHQLDGPEFKHILKLIEHLQKKSLFQIVRAQYVQTDLELLQTMKDSEREVVFISKNPFLRIQARQQDQSIFIPDIDNL